mgnify:CR=1 FL=1
MSLNDVRIREKNDGFVRVIPTEAAATDILAGEPVKMKADGSPYAIPLATGDPEIGTDQMLGIAITASDHTATADGEVSVFVPGPNSVLECKATTVANVDTQAEIDALVNDCVTMDLTGSVYTIDEDEGNDDNVHGLRIVGGDPNRQVLYFVVKPKAMSIDSEL